MNKERLMKLASELERCSRGRVLTIPGDGKAYFDMGTVVEKINPDLPANHSCGTAACAMGFAGLHPWFQARGLTWGPRTKYLMVNGRSRRFQEAATLIFGVTWAQAEELFNPDYQLGDETPKQVAKRIRKFVAKAETA